MTQSSHLAKAFAASVSLASPAVAQSFDGHLAFGLNAGDTSFETEQTRAHVRLDYRLSDSTTIGQFDLDAVAAGELWGGSLDVNRTHALREAYVEFSGTSANFGFGRQLRVQGVADGFSPTDVVAPRNFQLSRHETEGNRFGLDGLWSTVFLGDSVTVDSYVYAGHRSSVLPEGVLGPLAELPDTPVNSDDVIYGGRVSYLSDFGDFGLSYYNGQAAMPFLIPTATRPRAVTPHLEMIGVSTDTVFGAYRIYGEAALHQYSGGPFDVPEALLPDDEVLAAVGVEREMESGSRIGVQVFHRNLRDVRDPAVGPQAFFAQATRQIYGQFDDSQTGASLSYNWESADTRWSVNTAVSTWFDDDFYVGLQARYRTSENSGVYVNADLFDGPSDSFFGSYSDSSNLTLEFRQFF